MTNKTEGLLLILEEGGDRVVLYQWVCPVSGKAGSLWVPSTVSTVEEAEAFLWS